MKKKKFLKKKINFFKKMTRTSNSSSDGTYSSATTRRSVRVQIKNKNKNKRIRSSVLLQLMQKPVVMPDITQHFEKQSYVFENLEDFENPIFLTPQYFFEAVGQISAFYEQRKLKFEKHELTSSSLQMFDLLHNIILHYSTTPDIENGTTCITEVICHPCFEVMKLMIQDVVLSALDIEDVFIKVSENEYIWPHDPIPDFNINPHWNLILLKRFLYDTHYRKWIDALGDFIDMLESERFMDCFPYLGFVTGLCHEMKFQFTQNLNNYINAVNQRIVEHNHQAEEHNRRMQLEERLRQSYRWDGEDYELPTAAAAA